MKYRLLLLCFSLVSSLSGCQQFCRSVCENVNTHMTGNHACVVDGAQKPLLNTPDYRVKNGDTLYSIAFAADKDYQLLAAMNDLQPPYHLTIGQVLRLQSHKKIVLPEPSPLERQEIALLEPDYAKIAAKQSRMSANAEKKYKNIKNKKPSKSMVSGVIASQSIKKTPQMQKKSKVPKTHADNSSRRAKATATAHQTTKRIWRQNVSKQPVSNWQWPIRGKVIGTFDSGSVGNKGLDISATYGSPIRAAAPGTVVYSGSGLRGYGNLLIIKHNTRYLSAYAYNQVLLVKEGDTVKGGQVIAKMGRTNSGQVMLHFEIRRAGKPVDPKQYLG